MPSQAAPKMLAVLALSLAFLPVAPVSAQPVVAPGETLVFATADGGSAECRRAPDADIDAEDMDLACTLPRFRLGLLGPTTRVEPANNFVAAIIQPVVPVGLGAPFYATASVFNDFSVSNSVDDIVWAQVSATWDLLIQIGGGLAYNADVNLFLTVLDVTDGSPVALASQTLNTFDRSSDQGIEPSVDVGVEGALLRDETASLIVALRRGRDYRIAFQLRSSTSTIILGLPEAVGEAVWTDLRVTIDEDEFEQTAIHDMAVRSELAAHDTAVRGEVAMHDADIKARLDIIDARQEEIIRLLLTPQGRRESELGDFPLKPVADSGSDSGIGAFCAAQRLGTCNRADWLDDESRNPRDCRWRRGSCEVY